MNSTALQYFSPSQIASELGISRRTILHAIKTGRLPAHRLNARVLLVRGKDAAHWFSSTRTSSAKRITSEDMPLASTRER